ncbi:polyketide synthase [Brasilonema octagenarum UFV-E1]|uniref:Polyketide synthase n=1 Tax=Brasilonema sennae CENA114 TaxID=415709 RepID=A0A856MD40_9CYAN|nr:thioester reductase domain-containing protein [Brasilonema sennae]QDL08019.1 polyketide synthase [Brasilonema sennae CENA114]QDL14378.1 polyketide synthase [Brasilonema octagenarum UFV-E1]
MASKQSHTAEEIQACLVSILAEALKIAPDEINVQDSLENYGLNSAQAMLLITQAEKMLGFEVSPMLLWHYPNIEALSERLAEESQDLESQVDDKVTPRTNVSVSKTTTVNLQAEAVLDSNIRPSLSYQFTTELNNVFLTGGTGFLGAFLIDELLRTTDADIYCLVRATTSDEGKQKVKKNLQQYLLWNEEFSPRIIAIPGDLSQPLLGMSTEGFEMLAANLDAVYHSAAMLNYVYPYSALKTANVLGTQEVIRLASSIKAKPLHYVSSVAVFESPAYAGKVVKEQDKFDHWEGIFLGYSQTKWVAEKLVKIAGDRGLPVTIHRPPLISGHSQTGISNTHDFTNLMIKGCLEMGCFPDVDYMLDMSPVDYVSQAIAYLSRQKESIGKAFHLQHPEPISLKMLVEWMHSFGFPIELVPYDEWQSMLVKNVTSQQNPLYTLRPFLLQKWSQEGLTIPDLYLQAKRPIISCQDTLKALAGSSIVCPPIDSRLFLTYSSYLISSGFLNVA